MPTYNGDLWRAEQLMTLDAVTNKDEWESLELWNDREGRVLRLV